MTTDAHASDAAATRGFLFALSAYLLWGALPLFMKAVAHIPAIEVVAHRIIWSVPVAGVTLLALGRAADVKVALRSPRTVLMAAVTAAFITCNWSIYVWAIAVDRTVETALGYYINPLVSVLMGAALLGERLNRFQIAAIALAAVAVLILALDAGGVPWVSLALAITFAIYGFLRKTLPIGPSQGFFLEVMILALPALGYIIWLQMHGEGHFVLSNPGDIGLLMACGPVTAVPLMLYAFGAKLLRLSTIGLMQYIAPTIIFLIAVFGFGEPFSGVRVIAFVLIWMALAIYTWSMFFRRPAVQTDPA
ncbi:chloramphenicol-sensitive protein RarD [Mesorhizobium soli]|jgi:chloramphenicol-sensitive protein RarD|uniref:EamA family transporter RarD n=1 Tax=Pseudaminobacter soli (ex Li et al. 2025) TaxID=1295366 RepID=UPI002474DD75|nr:EamA family transporter RarD [Mesorhizobium soli]MDH6229984.1 chloramphenicol-sensitive protein RarD [Mesorhizobium soli]